MTFRKATVTGTKALMCLYAESGGGKTYSALLLARGLAGPDGRIAMIDTENRRGELYADDPAIGGYDVAQLGEPFAPQRLIDMIDESEKAGYDAIVIDSGSHFWDGIGGVTDMAAELAEKRFLKADWNKGKEWDGVISFGDWKEPKKQHKHLIQKLMRCNAHVIICLRAQYKSRQVDKKDYEKFGIDSRAKTTVIRDEYQSPIQEERFIFEMTVHAQMSNTNPGVPIITKCPAMLLPVFPKDQRITVESGARMRAFYDRGAPASPVAENLIEKARAAAEGGVEAYRDFFTALSPDQKRELVTNGEHDRLKQKLDAPAAEPDHPGPQDEEPEGGFRRPGDEGYVPPSFDD